MRSSVDKSRDSFVVQRLICAEVTVLGDAGTGFRQQTGVTRQRTVTAKGRTSVDVRPVPSYDELQPAAALHHLEGEVHKRRNHQEDQNGLHDWATTPVGIDQSALSRRVGQATSATTNSASSPATDGRSRAVSSVPSSRCSSASTSPASCTRATMSPREYGTRS